MGVGGLGTRFGGTASAHHRTGESWSAVTLRLYLSSPGDPTDSVQEVPLRLSQYFGVPRTQERRALGPRGAQREEEAAAAKEPGGPVRSVRFGWKTLFLITPPSRSARVARRAGLARLSGAVWPVFSCAMGGAGLGTGVPGRGRVHRRRRTCLWREDPEIGLAAGLVLLPSSLLPVQVGSQVGALAP